MSIVYSVSYLKIIGTVEMANQNFPYTYLVTAATIGGNGRKLWGRSLRVIPNRKSIRM